MVKPLNLAITLICYFASKVSFHTLRLTTNEFDNKPYMKTKELDEAVQIRIGFVIQFIRGQKISVKLHLFWVVAKLPKCGKARLDALTWRQNLRWYVRWCNEFIRRSYIARFERNRRFFGDIGDIATKINLQLSTVISTERILPVENGEWLGRSACSWSSWIIWGLSYESIVVTRYPQNDTSVHERVLTLLFYCCSEYFQRP